MSDLERLLLEDLCLLARGWCTPDEREIRNKAHERVFRKASEVILLRRFAKLKAEVEQKVALGQTDVDAARRASGKEPKA